MKKPMRRRTPGGSKKPPAIAIIVDEKLWRQDADALRLIRRAVRLALSPPSYPRSRGEAGATSSLSPMGGEGQGEGDRRSLTILLTNNARLRALNAHFRGKDKPTNVLSFPAAEDPAHLGDIAIAYGVVKREAKAQGKSFAAHAAHLAVHGTLHLRGFDHEKSREARAMEAAETAILAKLGIADPYAARPYTRGGKAA